MEKRTCKKRRNNFFFLFLTLLLCISFCTALPTGYVAFEILNTPPTLVEDPAVTRVTKGIFSTKTETLDISFIIQDKNGHKDITDVVLVINGREYSAIKEEGEIDKAVFRVYVNNTEEEIPARLILKDTREKVEQDVILKEAPKRPLVGFVTSQTTHEPKEINILDALFFITMPLQHLFTR